MYSRRVAATLAAFGAFTSCLNSSGGGTCIEPIEKTRIKGLSSEEMGTKGNGKKLSRAQRKAKTRRQK